MKSESSVSQLQADAHNKVGKKIEKRRELFSEVSESEESYGIDLRIKNASPQAHVRGGIGITQVVIANVSYHAYLC